MVIKVISPGVNSVIVLTAVTDNILDIENRSEIDKL
jgi:hypothetical protein